MTSSASIKRRLDRLEQLVARLRRLPASLDVVDLLTRMTNQDSDPSSATLEREHA